MASRFRRKASRPPEELDVTTFMNLMVVLVPFLLLSAVFSEITIHDLSLPTIAENSAVIEDRNKLNLEVVVRRGSLEVLDRGKGRLAMLINHAEGHDFVGLHAKLKDLKAAYPLVTNVTLLLDPDVKYDQLIAAMDAARSYSVKVGDKSVKADLFPDVSIGDAPFSRDDGGGR